MSDFLLELGQNNRARALIKGLGLPIPMPQDLARATDGFLPRPLEDHEIAVGHGDSSPHAAVIAKTLAEAGAHVGVLHDCPSREEFETHAEAWSRPLWELTLNPEGPKLDSIVFDASGLTTTESLRALYDYFHPLMRRLKKCGRVVVLATAPGPKQDPLTRATQAALLGFTKSVAKEVGKKGSTANIIYVEENAGAHVEGPLRFLLSRRSVFVSGQPIVVRSPKSRKRPAFDWARPLEGKVALVTGAARGIGAATSSLLADAGATVVCLDRPADDGLLSKVARDVKGVPLPVDITTPQAPQTIADFLTENHEGLDIIVHNAGVTRDKTLARMKPEWWDQAVDINLGAVERITTKLLEGTLRDNGRIVCLSSVAGIAGNLGQTNYAASKSGILGYVRGLAPEVAKRGITVNAIAPGFIETRLTAAIPVMIREAGRRLSNLGQGGQPRDVGDAITFLSTPAALGITGTTLRVCGGALIGA
ncbi:MAG: 3-oxoacyl-ACP reductase [Nannocystaceae bacterium]